MTAIDGALAKADRLALITQRVGFALWQLQELEGTAAQCFVLLAQAKPGMGRQAAEPLLTKAKRGTFGATITNMSKAGLFDPEFSVRINALLAERNWLVHRSRETSRMAVHADEAMSRLLQRVDAIADEADVVHRLLGDTALRHSQAHGVNEAQIDAAAKAMLRQWHGGVCEKRGPDRCCRPCTNGCSRH